MDRFFKVEAKQSKAQVITRASQNRNTIILLILSKLQKSRKNSTFELLNKKLR